MSPRIGLAALLALFIAAPAVNAATALTAGTPLTVNFSANSLITNAYIDVGASAKQLTINVAGSSGDVRRVPALRHAIPGHGRLLEQRDGLHQL
ncbi:MAG: hypothetical protein QM741_02985 [Rudaea sp.]|uniref:hypothetical protein n=1 Tax=Rudaea sp. TaxID=2136325 RepID=UPI0039E2514A